MTHGFANKNTILRGLVGSTAYGINVGDGLEDRDEMGVCIEPKDYVIGLQFFEQLTYRSKPAGVRSEAGDLDLTIYSLRKWARLAAQGNPSILVLLFIPESDLVAWHPKYGPVLRNNAEKFASKSAGARFLGYMKQQKERMAGLRGQKNVTRPELVERYGYDTKYAMHAIRLGIQGIEYMKTGRMTLPLPKEDRLFLKGVRTGSLTLDEAVEHIESIESELKGAINQSTLPDAVNAKDIDDLIISLYEEFWQESEVSLG